MNTVMRRCEKVKKKIIFLIIAGLALSLLSTPVFAQGPENAVGKNPNATTELAPGVSILTPSGIDIDWILYAGPPSHIVWKDARYFKINSASIVTDANQVFAMEHTWLYLSQQVFYDFLILKNVPPYYANIIASLIPEGTYMNWVELGN
jgi:hypothetical protein